MSDNYVITITRQFGSLGRKIGKRVSEILDIAYYDRDIIENASKLMGENIEKLAQYDGHYYGNPFHKMMYPLGYGNAATQKKLFEVEKSIILEHAAYENCVIIGRCADNILKEHKKHLSIFIYAPFEERLKNCIREFKLSKDDAIKYMTSVDKGRANFYELVTGDDFESVNNRHIAIDSSYLGLEGTAQLIVHILKEKYQIGE